MRKEKVLMKILLINPPKYWNGNSICRDENGIGTCDVNFLPSQPILATAYLKGKGKHADMIDAEDQNISFGDYDIVVVFVCILFTFYEDIKWLKRAKGEGKKTIMILNDAHDGLEMEAMQKYDFIDVSVRLWEREIVLNNVISSWGKNNYPDFPGVIYRKNGQLVDTGRMNFSPNLEHLPSCSNILKEIPAGKYKAANITTGRGCPMLHRFCLYSRSKLRRRKIEDVISEFEIISTKVNMIHIMDPAMPVISKWFEEFCDELISRKIKIPWRTDLHVERCKPDILRKMKRAGCNIIMFNVPSMDSRLKEKIGGYYTSERLLAAVQDIRGAGMIPMPVFEIGWPWDDHESLSKIMNFVKETPLPWFSMRQFRPWKGTQLYEDCMKLGLLKSELGIDDYVFSANPNLNTLYLSKDEIQEWKYRISSAAKLSPGYLLRFILDGKQIKARHLFSFLRLILGKKNL